MEKIITYKAEDGTEFESENECIGYEEMFQSNDDDLQIYEIKNGKSIKIPIEKNKNLMERADVFIIKTERGARQMTNLCDYCDICSSFSETGIYFYNKETDDWDYLIDRLNKIIGYVGDFCTIQLVLK